MNRLAEKANFNRNTTEKVLRLFAILKLLNEGELEQYLVLKGGTALNLFLLDLPRLSVDIDLDFDLSLERDEMMEKRKYIDKKIKEFMEDEGYFLSEKSKFVHTLDSYVYSYTTLTGSNDILKIEINYSDRVHVLKPAIFDSTTKLGETIRVKRLANEELIGSKINALLVRTTPRDIYDVYTLFKNKHVINEKLIRKIVIFYVCLGSEIPVNIEKIIENATLKIRSFTFQKIKETLIPVLHKGIKFNIEEITLFVSEKLSNFLIFDENDIKFINEYNNKRFKPEILFYGHEIEDVSKHPMGIWKTKQNS